MTEDRGPLLHLAPPVQRLMLTTLLLSLLPLLAGSWRFGPGLLLQVLGAVLGCLLAEWLLLRWRGLDPLASLADGSALLTGVLLGLCLPPLAPLWLAFLGGLFAVGVAKQAYGGLGRNPFNPAMAGYAFLILSFPAGLAHWPAPGHGWDWATLGALSGSGGSDAVTGATVLELVRGERAAGLTLDEILAPPAASGALGDAAVMALAWLTAGAGLLWRKVIRWPIPAGVILGVVACAGLLWVYDGDHYLSPWRHLATASAMAAAFFIATDPVTSPASPRAAFWYGTGTGALLVLLREFGNFPDGVAFAVLVMNAAAPLLEQWLRPEPT